MHQLKPLFSNKALTLSLLFFTILTTQQVSELTFDYGFEYYPYYLAIGAVAFSMKVFFVAYNAFNKEIKNESRLGLLANLGFVISQLWLLQTSLQYLIESYYPLESFRIFVIISVIYLVQLLSNQYNSQRNIALIALLYYGGVFGSMFLFSIFSESVLGLQILSLVVAVLEVWQLSQVILFAERHEDKQSPKAMA